MTRNILYVDDEVDSRIIVADYLQNLGYHLITVEDAADALQSVRENLVDVAILDVNLIGVDGPELLARLQHDHPGLPVILYSGMRPEAPKVKTMLARGAQQFVSKNQPLENLVKALQGIFHPVH